MIPQVAKFAYSRPVLSAACYIAGSGESQGKGTGAADLYAPGMPCLSLYGSWLWASVRPSRS